MKNDNKIIKNYKIFDILLSKINNTELYKILISIRLLYAAAYGKPIDTKKSILIIIKNSIRLVWKLILLPVTQVKLSNIDDILILGNHRIDTETAKDLNIKTAKVIFEYHLTKQIFQNIGLYKIVFQAFWVLFTSKYINKIIAIKSLYGLIDYIIIYKNIDLKNIKVILTEADAIPEYMAILHRAQGLGIPTIKLDYFLIDGINHNNIYCDYYYCPSQLHKEIVSKFSYNTNLKYITGGFIHWDKIQNHKYQPSLNPKIISFFTHHGKIPNAKPETFYIDEILAITDETYMLYIKLHPYDNIHKFDKYKNNNRIRIINHGKIDNYELISASSFTFSMLSTLTLEAKHICPESFFINYDPAALSGLIDYEKFGQYIDIINNADMLKLFFEKKLQPKDKLAFITFFNTCYPHSRETLLNFIKTITENEYKPTK